MGPAIDLFTDGAFRFARNPGFGWVAVDARAPAASGQGSFPNDGSNNFAAEARAAREALVWAVQNGYRTIRLHTDFETMGRPLRSPKPAAYREIGALREFVAQENIEIEVINESSKHPFMLQAHHLARAAVAA